MALTVATNTGALMAQAAASSVNKEMEISMERLSTGKRINGASDDAAGVAIASRLTSEIRGTNQAIRNAMDGQALIDTAEGAHAEIESILQRMREVAVQAANDTNSSTDREAMATEMAQLKDEINRIAATTTWAGVSLLNGDGDPGVISTTADEENDFNFQISSNETGSSDTLTVAIAAVDATSLGVGGTATQATVTVTSVVDEGDESLGMSTGSAGVFTLVHLAAAGDAAAEDTMTFTIEGTSYTYDAFTHGTQKGYNVTDDAGFTQSVIQFIEDQNIAGITAAATTTALEIDVKKANSLSVASTSAANTTMDAIDDAILELNTQRAKLGSYSNRLDSTVSNLTNVSANLQLVVAALKMQILQLKQLRWLSRRFYSKRQPRCWRRPMPRSKTC
jgi:flagellin